MKSPGGELGKNFVRYHGALTVIDAREDIRNEEVLLLNIDAPIP